MDSADGTNNAAAAAAKRKAEDINNPPAMLGQPPYAPQHVEEAASPQKAGAGTKKKSKLTDSAKVQARLEANRKAARESRRRKKVLVEELQRSVIFFSRANGQLKQKNDELQRMLIQAQAQIAARNGNAAADAEGGQEVQEGQGGETNNDDPSMTEGDGGAFKNDVADSNEEDNSTDIPQGGLPASTGEQQEIATTDAQPQQQQEVANLPFPGMVQQPIPFTAVPGAPAMDPNAMLYMMMMGGNPLANAMMAANPMMALQMFNQLNAAGAVAGGVPNQQPQAQTQGASAPLDTAAAAAAPTAFPAMPVGMGNVVMPTPGGAFNPFGGFPAPAGAVNPAAPAGTIAEGDSSTAAAPSAEADDKEEVDV